MSKYKGICNDLRESAIADIKKYIQAKGPTQVKNFGGLKGVAYKFDIYVTGDILVIASASATLMELEDLCLLADMINKLT